MCYEIIVKASALEYAGSLGRGQKSPRVGSHSVLNIDYWANMLEDSTRTM